MRQQFPQKGVFVRTGSCYRLPHRSRFAASPRRWELSVDHRAPRRERFRVEHRCPEGTTLLAQGSAYVFPFLTEYERQGRDGELVVVDAETEVVVVRWPLHPPVTATAATAS